MKNTISAVGRLIGIAVLAAGAMGCTKTTLISPRGTFAPNADLDLELQDGTTLALLGAYARGGDICGTPSPCAGLDCASSVRCIAREEIAVLSVRKVAVAEPMLVVGSLALGAAAMVLLATSGHGSSTNAGSSSGSSNDRHGDSCPRVYSWNGDTWRLDSGTYGLSYFQAAPRTDFDRLDHLVADHGEYRMRFVNEQDETEHTDLVRLWVVDHPKGTRIVPAASGTFHLFRDELRPTLAHDFRGSDVRELVMHADEREWSSDLRGRNADNAADARDGLRLVFAKPVNANIAKLRIAAHNTTWAGDMLRFMLEQRGSTLPAWYAKMNSDDGARAAFIAFVTREGMLNVRVKTPSGWSTRGVFWAAGPEIVKEEAFAISVADIGGETLEVELESALGFWGIDAVSVAYGPDESVTRHRLSPHRARTNDGRDVTAKLARVDGDRFDTVRGDIAELAFAAPTDAAPGLDRSFILETTGYDIPDVVPAPIADPGAMDALMATPFAASRLALGLRLASGRGNAFRANSRGQRVLP